LGIYQQVIYILIIVVEKKLAFYNFIHYNTLKFSDNRIIPPAKDNFGRQINSNLNFILPNHKKMKTHYYCKSCDIFFWDEKETPNINRIHNKCGSQAKLLNHIPETESEES